LECYSALRINIPNVTVPHLHSENLILPQLAVDAIGSFWVMNVIKLTRAAASSPHWTCYRQHADLRSQNRQEN